MTRVFLFAAAAAAVFLGSGQVSAQSMDERARLHFQAATSHFDAGNYEDARREFEMAYQLSSRPGLLYNLYLTHERLGETAEAASYLERYLTDQPNIDRREVLQLRLENLRRRLAGNPPLESDSGPESESLLRAEAGEPPPLSEDPQPEEGPGGPTLLVPSVVAFAVAGVGAILWGTFGILALSEDSTLSDECGVTRACGDDELSDLSTYNTVADVGLAVTLVGAAAGVTLLLVGGSSESSSSVAIRPSLGLANAGLGADVRF